MNLRRGRSSICERTKFGPTLDAWQSLDNVGHPVHFKENVFSQSKKFPRYFFYLKCKNWTWQGSRMKLYIVLRLRHYTLCNILSVWYQGFPCIEKNQRVTFGDVLFVMFLIVQLQGAITVWWELAIVVMIKLKKVIQDGLTLIVFGQKKWQMSGSQYVLVNLSSEVVVRNVARNGKWRAWIFKWILPKSWDCNGIGKWNIKGI